MKYTKVFVAILVITSFLIMFCTPRQAPPTSVSQTPDLTKGGGVTSLKQGWEVEWDAAMAAGKKEGTVSVYATLVAPPLREYAPTFKQKYGIEIEITTGRGADMAQKLLRERAAGIYFADVVISGLNTFFGSVKKSGATSAMPSKLILPEVKDPKLWYTVNDLPWADEDKHVFSFYAYPNRDIHINTDFVKPGEIQSWQDLLNPKYRGKIIWSDPSITGSGFNGFSTLIYHKVLTPDFYRQMVANQQIQVTRDLRLQVDWLARGKAWIAISAEGQPVAEHIRAGASLDVVTPKEGTYLSVDAGNLSVTDKAPHPNASKVFVNWALSKEGQRFLQSALKYSSARNDLPTDDVNPANVREPGVKYYIGANSIEKWVLEEQDKYIALAENIFGPLIGR